MAAGRGAGRVTFSFTRVPEGPIAAFLDFVRLGRDLGFDRLWVPDQTYYADPFALLALVAAAVPGLELGLAVTNPYTRHPVQIARAAATVAEISGGRFLLGLGAGNRKHVIDRLGLDGRAAAERVREATLVIRRLLAGERVTHQGYWTLKGIKLEREGPLDVPIFIATRNPRMLRVAGQVGDGVMLESLVSPAAQAYGLQEMRTGAAAAGRDVAGMEIVAWQSVNITDNRAAGVEAMRSWVAYILGMTTPPVAARMGIRPEIIERVHQVFTTDGPEAAVAFVGEEEVDRVVIVGNPSHVAAKCLALIRGGATDFAVQVKADDFSGQPVRDDRAARAGLERFAREVKPVVLEQLAQQSQ
jgi:5,10-methylenetetrahydromethanopterin reductase